GWKQLMGKHDKQENEVKSIEQQIDELTRALAAATTVREQKHAAQKPLRDVEQECASLLQRLTMQHHELMAEENRQKQNLEAAKNRLQQTGMDIERETQFQHDVEQALQNLA